MKITQVISHRTVRTRRVLVSHAVKLEGALNGGPVEKDVEPILQRVGQVIDLNGTTAAQVAKFLQSSQDAILLQQGGLRVSINPSASDLAIVVCSADERPDRLPKWSPELQEEAGNLSARIADALR